MRRALVVALHDGFYSAATGAGLSNQTLLMTVAAHLPDDTDLVVLPVRLDPTSPEYDPAVLHRTLSVLDGTTHKILPLDNGTDGRTRFGDLMAFQVLAKDAARVIRDLTHEYCAGTLLAIDRPFVGLGHHLPEGASWRAVYLPRSTALHHDDFEQVTWERENLAGWLDGGATLGATSTHMRELLIRNHRVPANRIIDVPNGLAGLPAPLSAAPPIPSAAEDGFMLAFGRAAPYKGFDDLLDALELVHTPGVPVPHLLLAAVTDTDETTTYQRHLARRCVGRTVTLWTRFNPGLPGLLRHPALRAVIVPSRIEPFGRIPLEAFTVGAGPVIATTAGGLTDTVVDGVTGFSAEPGDPASLADAIHGALGAESHTKARMARAGQQLAADRDYTRTITALVDQLHGGAT